MHASNLNIVHLTICLQIKLVNIETFIVTIIKMHAKSFLAPYINIKNSILNKQILHTTTRPPPHQQPHVPSTENPLPNISTVPRWHEKLPVQRVQWL